MYSLITVFFLNFDLERWPSGLRRTLGKCVKGKLFRGFESRSLRQIYKIKFLRVYI